MQNAQQIDGKIAAFFAKYPEKIFVKRQIIIHAGEDPPGVFLITEGRVSQYDISNAGADLVVNVFKSPAFFPMSWAVNRTANEYFYEAATRVVVRQAPADEVIAFIRSEPDLLFDLLSRVYRGTDGVLRRMSLLMGGDASSRLLFELLNAARRFGEPDGYGSVRLPLNEGDLAKHSGLARETVSRVIKGFKAAGLIQVTKTGVTVPDIKQLEAELDAKL